MSALELKGGIYDMISKIKDKELLLDLHEMIADVLKQNLSKTDFWDELSSDQQKELELAIEESYLVENHVSYETVMEKYTKWLKP